jgi:hypothetical protein
MMVPNSCNKKSNITTTIIFITIFIYIRITHCTLMPATCCYWAKRAIIYVKVSTGKYGGKYTPYLDVGLPF